MLRSRMMIIISVTVGILVFFTLVFLLNVSAKSAEDMSVLVTATVLVYMMLFHFIIRGNVDTEFTPSPTHFR
jgi:hypothetical protein